MPVHHHNLRIERGSATAALHSGALPFPMPVRRHDRQCGAAIVLPHSILGRIIPDTRAVTLTYKTTVPALQCRAGTVYRGAKSRT